MIICNNLADQKLADYFSAGQLHQNHIACRNLDAADKLLVSARKIFRRAGVIGITDRKVMVEIIVDKRLETIIADKDFVADENYIKQLVKYANENFVENKKKSNKLLKILKTI